MGQLKRFGDMDDPSAFAFSRTPINDGDVPGWAMGSSISENFLAIALEVFLGAAPLPLGVLEGIRAAIIHPERPEGLDAFLHEVGLGAADQ
jgi:hypothetical protein